MLKDVDYIAINFIHNGKLDCTVLKNKKLLFKVKEYIEYNYGSYETNKLKTFVRNN